MTGRLVRVSKELDNSIKRIQAETEKQIGIKISYAQASTIYDKTQKYKNFKVRIKNKGVIEISQL